LFNKINILIKPEIGTALLGMYFALKDDKE